LRAFLAGLARAIDALTVTIGKAASWLVFGLVLITLFDVLMRYGFSAGSIWIQELEWHFYAIGFMLAAAFTLQRDGHARVDVLSHSLFGPRGRAAVELFGTFVFLLPFCAVVVWASLPFVESSWRILEGSPDPGGLPGLFLVKAVIPLTFVLLALQGISQAAKACLVLFGPETETAQRQA